MNFEERDLRDLEKAVNLLEQNTITEKMTKVVGKPLDYLMGKLPKGAEKQIHSIVEKALHKAADAALVIPPFLGAFKSRGHAACARRCFGV